MNRRNGWILLAVMGMIAALVIFQQGFAAGKETIPPARIGVVNVTKILEACKKNQQWQEKAETDRAKMQAEFQQMRQDLDALQANIKARKQGSSDYYSLMNEYEEKRAIMEGKNTFYENKFTQEMQQWMEALYGDLLKSVNQVAKEKGLDLVLGQETLDLPAPTLRDFMLSVKTKKVLYAQSDLDITDSVLTVLDGMSN